MIILLLAPIALPAIAALGYAVLGWQLRTAWLGTLAAAGSLASGIALASVVSGSRPARRSAGCCGSTRCPRTWSS